MSSTPVALHWVAPGSPRQVQEAPYQGGRYQIYPWKGGWTFNRTDHPLLPKFDGWATAECEAMMLCQNDYQKVARLIAWVEYILNNGPPSP
ncbi:Uncharacterised protein [Mycobacteroides abscessus subsp. abscessus]|nr:Uncharacterised protein [Mycobacteroides abscessus subsp. abscessus]SIN44769.1 Uncharacterised protein [Mycobacteroides abscessus subsp. abscessus]SLE92607.1 Uncharacterised protein [Mycobacteroides abscessus subsp. abscessus]